MVCLRNISVDTLHKGESEDNNNNNNNKCANCHEIWKPQPPGTLEGYVQACIETLLLSTFFIYIIIPCIYLYVMIHTDSNAKILFKIKVHSIDHVVAISVHLYRLN
jgi:hypothetical protein